jgi:integral membrane sensor domain MASE1
MQLCAGPCLLSKHVVAEGSSVPNKAALLLIHSLLSVHEQRLAPLWQSSGQSVAALALLHNRCGWQLALQCCA